MILCIKLFLLMLGFFVFVFCFLLNLYFLPFYVQNGF